MSNLDTTASPRPLTRPSGWPFCSRPRLPSRLLFGYDTAVINGAVNAIRDRYDIGAGATGLSVSLTLLGAALGAWVAGSIADRLGRIRVMQIAAALFVVGALGSAFPFGIVDLTLWRILAGSRSVSLRVIAPAYIAEIAPAAIRGRLGSMYQLAIVLGIAVSQLVNYAISDAAGGGRGELFGSRRGSGCSPSNPYPPCSISS